MHLCPYDNTFFFVLCQLGVQATNQKLVFISEAQTEKKCERKEVTDCYDAQCPYDNTELPFHRRG